MIRIVIADDQPVIRDGIKFIVEQDHQITVVGSAANGQEAMELCDLHQPDVVLMDIVMPICDGVTATKALKEKYPNMKVIILTTFNDKVNLANALKNGADSYVLKDIESDDLILIIKSMTKGLRVVHENAFDYLINSLDLNTRPGQLSSFSEDIVTTRRITTKEIEIIKQIVYGKSNKEIAAFLDLSEGSVRNTISAILTKLELLDRTQLAVFAVRNNLV